MAVEYIFYMINKIVSLVAIVLGIFISLKYFNIYSVNFLPYDLTLIGAVFLILMQFLTYMMVHASNQGTTFMGKLIKTILAVPGILYLINIFYPLNLGFNFEIIIALFLFTEGIYGLH